MRALGGGQSEENRQLLKDLAFIKRKLRYPISRRTMPAALAIAGLLYFVLRATLSFFYIQHARLLLWLVIPGIMLIAAASMIFGYIQTLRFKVITTPFTTNENIILVHDFLRSQQLLIHQLAEAPEVCQIASRPLGSAREDRREIMVFIACDNRILINSHFTGQRYTISSPSRNYKMMAKYLNDWLQANYNKDVMTMRKRH